MADQMLGYSADQAIPAFKPTLYIMRGCPGSGKSTLSSQILKARCCDHHQPHPHNPDHHPAVILTTDDFFMVPVTDSTHPDYMLQLAQQLEPSQPTYVFDGKRIGEAHAWNQARFKHALQMTQTHTIIVDNTCTQFWEAKPYIEMLLAKFGRNTWEVELVEPDTPWWLARDAQEMARRNSHGVPQEAVERMLSRWEATPADRNQWIDVILASQPPKPQQRRGPPPQDRQSNNKGNNNFNGYWRGGGQRNR